jgi:hypothetical protein
MKSNALQQRAAKQIAGDRQLVYKLLARPK